MNNKAEMGALTFLIFFIVMLSITAYFTVGINYNEETAESYKEYYGQEYNDPIQDWNETETQMFTPTNTTPTFDWGWHQIFLPFLIWEGWDFYNEVQDWQEDGEYTEGDGLDMAMGYLGIVGNMITLNITPLNDLGIIGLAVKILVWITLLYIFLKLIPFVG